MPGKIQKLERKLNVMQQQIYEGPLSPPQILEAYEKIKPNAAQEIFDMARKAQEHEITMEKEKLQYANKVLNFNFILGLLGQLGTIIITLAGYIMAFIFIKVGEPNLGYSSAAISIAISGYLIWWKVHHNSKSGE